MSDESDLIKLYSQRILALASDIPRHGRLDAPDGTAKKRSPLCGSTITVDVRIADGRIIDFAQNVKACALGQASAAVIGAQIIGRTETELQLGRDQLAAMLKESGPAPDTPFDRLEVLKPAAEHRNRHASILLCFDATLAAMESARNANCA